MTMYVVMLQNLNEPFSNRLFAFSGMVDHARLESEEVFEVSGVSLKFGSGRAFAL